MIEELKRNVETQIEMLREISSYTRRLDYATEYEQKLLTGSIKALRNSMKLINDSVPVILGDISMNVKLPNGPSEPSIHRAQLTKVNFKRLDSNIEVIVKIKDKNKFFEELSINESLLKRLKKRRLEEEEKHEEYKAARGYLKLANKFFQKSAIKYIDKGYFVGLEKEVKKSNIDILFETYIAMMMFSAFISIFAGIIIMIAMMFIDVSLGPPFISAYSGSYLVRLVKVFWIVPVVPVVVFFLIYLYPTTEKNSIAKRVEQELPFAVIQMSAISGAGIAPSQLFKIIADSKEYPYLRKEIRKVLNQINLYGYDVVTALSNAAKSAPTEKLAELFSGLATSITSGANMSDFFERRAATLLISYRLEREKYTKIAETFMDIYISVVIAAPMILLLLLIVLQFTGSGIGSPFVLTLLIVTIVALLNVVFIWFLGVKQPAF